jgi:hypothetical protein
MIRHYILDGHKAVPCDFLTPTADGGFACDDEKFRLWGEAFHRDRHVAKTDIGKVHVSTVFLGLDHGYGGAILLFETMIFGGEHDGYQERYSTWEEAEVGHKQAVALVEGSSLEKAGAT